MSETVRKSFKIFFHPKSPANVYRNPRRLLSNLVARSLNLYLGLLNRIRPGEQASLNYS